MKKKVMIYIVAIICFLAGGFATTKTCQAASAQVTITADSKDITVGDSIFVYINIDSDTLFGDFEANLTYDEELLQYKEGESVINGGDGFLRVSDMGVLQGDNTRRYTMEFEAIKSGYCEISFEGRTPVYEFTNGNEMSVSSSELTLNIKAQPTASTNAKLKSLTISSYKLSPTFDPGITEYDVSVDSETEELVISALPEDEKATISINGNEKFQEGKNNIIISVIAESGDVIKYTIHVNKSGVDVVPTTPPDQTTPEETNAFEIVSIDGEEYIIVSGRFKLIEAGSEVQIPEGYQVSSITLAGTSVTAYVPEDNAGSDFILLYAMNEKEEANFYRFDKVENTLLRYNPDAQKIETDDGVSADKMIELEKQYNDNLTKAAIFIAILCVVSGVLAFVSIRFWLKLKRRR
ncbi:MAG: cadherin-like beta sandwich domain-containing protein [Mobilitalea sp.]